MRARNGGKEDVNGYLEPLVQQQDKHKYLELLEDGAGGVSGGVNGKPRCASPSAKKTATNGKNNVTYAQLASSDIEDDEYDEEDEKGGGGKYDRRGRLRRNHMSPPKEQAPPHPPSLGGGRFSYNPPDTKNKTNVNHSDLSGLGTNHWPQNNIPALPLPPPREQKFLRDPRNEELIPAEYRLRYRSRGFAVAPFVILDKVGVVRASMGGFGAARINFWCFGFSKWWPLKMYWQV